MKDWVKKIFTARGLSIAAAVAGIISAIANGANDNQKLKNAVAKEVSIQMAEAMKNKEG